MANLLAERTNGRITLDVQPSISILDHEEAIITGLQDIAMSSLGGLSRYYPPYGAFEAAYMFRDLDHFYATVDSRLGERLHNEFEERSGLHILDVWHQGIRQVTLAHKLATTPEEFSSIKLRVPANVMFVEMARVLGAQPTTTSFENVSIGLRSGVIDGQENPLPTIKAMGFDTLCDYLVLTSHMIGTIAPVIGKKHWDSISPEDRAIIEQAFRDGREYNRRIIEEEEAELFDEFSREGMTIVTPDLAPFRARAERSWRKFQELWGESLVEEIQAVN